MTFTNEGTLRAFPQFKKLDDNIQAIVLQLLRETRLNSYGGFKRPPNAWLIFRSGALAEADTIISSQSQFSVQCKARWATVTTLERASLQEQAQQASNELLELFPDYCYKPMPPAERERWNRLGPKERKEFWLASAVRIAERIAKPEGEWHGFLRFDEWMNECASASRSSVDTSSAESGPATPPDNRATPEPSRQRLLRNRLRLRGSTCTTSGSSNCSTSTATLRRSDTPPEWLKGVLVDIGPQKPGGIRRRLVPATFQLARVPQMIWVEEEIQDDASEDDLRKLYKGQPVETEPRHVILRGYANPQVPPSFDGYGWFGVPWLGSPSQYHEYMAAYRAACEAGSDFIWRLAPPNPPSDSKTAAKIEDAPSNTTLVVKAQGGDGLLLDNHSPKVYAPLPPDQPNEIHHPNTSQLKEAPEAINIKTEAPQFQSCRDNSPLHTEFTLGLAGLNHFNPDSYQPLGQTHDASTQMVWGSSPDIVVDPGMAFGNNSSMGLDSKGPLTFGEV